MDLDELYDALTRALEPISEGLDECGKTELDGILWVLAQRLALKACACDQRKADTSFAESDAPKIGPYA